MKSSVLDGVVAIEANAAKLVDDAKLRARQKREKVAKDLDELAGKLDQEAKADVGRHTADAEKGKAAAQDTLDRQLASAQAAVQRVRDDRLAPMVGEVLRLLEQRADGD